MAHYTEETLARHGIKAAGDDPDTFMLDERTRATIKVVHGDVWNRFQAEVARGGR